MKRAIVVALAILVAAVLSTAALARPSAKAASTASQAINCKGTFDLPFITPLTGGAAFLGTEQASWAKYAVKTLAPKYGLKVKLLLGDTPVEQGPAPAVALAQKYIADKKVVAVLGPSTSGNAGATARRRASGSSWTRPAGTRRSQTDRRPLTCHRGWCVISRGEKGGAYGNRASP